MFAPGTYPDLLADAINLLLLITAGLGVVWAATAPIRKRLDQLNDLAAQLTEERERVDDLDKRVTAIESALKHLQSRVDELHGMVAALLARPARRHRPNDDSSKPPS